MIFHETSPNVFAEVNGDLRTAEATIPAANFNVWSDAELATHDCYRLEMPATPAGKLRTKYAVQRVDGVVSIVCEYEDAPPIPSPPPPKIHKRLLIERLDAAGLLTAAFAVLGGPGSRGYERWQASTFVDTGNPEVRGLISAIGGNLNELLAPDPSPVE